MNFIDRILNSLVGVWRGSSPRLRGTPAKQTIKAKGRRFIPASAGNTRISR